jgi:flagellar biosynthesis/type III secretory pathway M-ring protein FliF/YscJ
MITFLLAALAAAYIVLKVINTRARFAEEDARRAEAEAEALAAAEEEAEDEMIRAKAIDVEAEVIGADNGSAGNDQ